MEVHGIDGLIASAKILIVDDEIFHTRLVERFLRSIGYSNIVVTNDPRTVRELQFQQDFDLVLLDVDMPHLNGFEVISLLDAHRKKDDYLPILVFTGHADRDVRLKALAAGAKDFLTKPLEPDEARHRIRNLLQVRILHNLNRIERNRYQDLLGSILPRPIIARLRKGEERIADRLDCASVLFSDLVGFTGFSTGREPREIISSLSAIFGAFDRLVVRHGMEKIKTIGDAYMVVGGLERGDTDHAQRAADLALDMINAIETSEEARRVGLTVRIGLHCGPLVAGLLGGTKSTYDVWGDTVNTASRFESASLPGRINVSGDFAAQLDGKFELEPRGPIALKGKGEMDAYFVGQRFIPVRHKSEHSFRLDDRDWNLTA